MKTTAKDLAAWLADKDPDMEIWAGAKKPGEFPCEDAVIASVKYLANRSRIRLEDATNRWRDSINGPSDQRLAAWIELAKLRGEFEAEQEGAA